MAVNTKTGIKRKNTGIGIRTKLLFWLLFIALLPIVVISYFGYQFSAKALYKVTSDRLQSTLFLQQQALKNYYVEREKNLANIADDVEASQLRTYASLAAIKSARYKALTKFFKSHKRELELFARSPRQQKIFSRFITASSKNLSSGDLSFLKNWMKDRKLQSLTLVRPDGEVLYASDKRTKPGAKIKKRTLEDDALGNGRQQSSFTGFARSSLYPDEIAGYFSAPFKSGKALTAVLLFRVRNNALDEIMQDQTNLGESGETFLVGPDGMFRSNSRYFKEPTLLNPAFLVDTESVAEALVGINGEQLVVNYRGEYVLSSYMPIKVGGSTWALVAEINQHEAVAPRLGAGEDYLKRTAAQYGFPDLYLIDPDGYMFYSTGHKSDYQTNLITGSHMNSGLAKTVLEVLDSKAPVVSDYSLYEPAGNKPAAFLAKPILRAGEVSVIVAFQIPVDQINNIMSRHGQLAGGSVDGDTYLVGQDKMWRSESLQAEKYHVKSTMLNMQVKVNSEAVNKALAGDSGTKIITNGIGEKVLSSWAPFTFKHLKWAIISEIPRAEIEKPVKKLLFAIGLLALFSIAAVAGIGLLVAGGITKQIGAIMSVMTKVEEGDYDTMVEVTSRDELGSMASSFNEMIGKTKSLIKTRQDEHDQLQRSIMEMLIEISDVSEGDMTVRATVREDATGTLADSLNMMLEELSQAIAKIKKSSEQVGVTASALSSSTEELAVRSDSQSELIRDAVTEINQMASTIDQVADQANRSAETSTMSAVAAAEGTRAVEDTSKAMEAIRSNVQSTARAIKQLGESSQEISDFAKIIDGISDRTSILALNASIQAAAAGEEGRGFAVVAEEIQRLAERSTASTRKIEVLIRNILNEITHAGASIDASIQEVVQGAKLSEDALLKLRDINSRSSRVAELIGEVSLTTGKQAKSSIKLAGAMSEIGVISTETADETRKTSSLMRDMAAVADEMLQSVAVFKLPNEIPSGSSEESAVENVKPEIVNVEADKMEDPSLITELKQEHEILFTSLDELKTFDLTSQERWEKLVVLKGILLDHLKKEDEQFYPVLREEAKSDVGLKNMLLEYARDMDEITAFVGEFYEKYAVGGGGGDNFEEDFGLLYSTLSQRISREESILFEKYSQLHQQGRLLPILKTDSDDSISLKEFLDSAEDTPV